MKLYAFIRSGKHYEDLIKVSETNGSIEKRIREQEGTGLDKFTVIWENAVWTQRYGIDKMIHRVLRERGFRNPPLPSGEPSEYFECSVSEIEKAFAEIKKQLDTEEKLREAVGEQFYREIRNWFYWAVGNTNTENTAAKQEYTLRLIVRLLLLFFFAEKELVPKELLDEHWRKENFKDNEYSFYNTVLRNVFFHCLNTPLKERTKYDSMNLTKNVRAVKEQFQKIPFLNGGIFNEHAGDDTALSNHYFFSEIHTEKIEELAGDYKVEGLVRILSKYKYKLSLDDLLDRADYTKTIDPEFIGKVFESLLDCIAAETKESRRKVTGSYYTPREIVDYMVNESLDAYLLQRASGGTCPAGGKANPFDNDVQKLLDVKILDPACGSGAFPCGIMNAIMNRIDPDSTMPEIKRYHTKLKILQNVIYGVDIQPMAVQIAVLRLFLSLIQSIVPDKKKDNYGIEPLPNLETKFVCANTLIDLQRQEKQGHLELPIVKATVKQLQLTRNQHLVASNPAEKMRLQEFDESLRNTLSIALEDGGDLSHDAGVKLASWNPYDQTNRADFFDSYYMFGVEKFDIVIGNPPYGAAYPDGQKKYFREHYKSAKTITGKQKGSLDTFSLFIEKGFHLTKKGGWCSLIVPMSVVSSDSMTALHNILLQNCGTIKISNYCDRPLQLFHISHKKVSIITFQKTKTACEQLLTTQMYRWHSGITQKQLLQGLTFIDGMKFCLPGRFPKISLPIEKRILKKLFAKQNMSIGKLQQENGKPIYYRTAGGMYYNVITNYPSGSTVEKPLFFDKKIADVAGAILSSSLFWWYQQVYTDGLSLKTYEMETFTIPVKRLTPEAVKRIEKLYKKYLTDIEKNVRVHQTGEYKNVTEFKEYKIRYSKPLIDAIDDLVCPLYGLTAEETAFIKSYELEFRMRGE